MIKFKFKPLDAEIYTTCSGIVLYRAPLSIKFLILGKWWGVLSLLFDDVLDSSIASNVDMSSLFDVIVGGSPLALVDPINAKLVGELRRFTVRKF